MAIVHSLIERSLKINGFSAGVTHSKFFLLSPESFSKPAGIKEVVIQQQYGKTASILLNASRYLLHIFFFLSKLDVRGDCGI